ncbi:hypothetical protein Q7P37_003772 [Cladosporium fusiforme]
MDISSAEPDSNIAMNADEDAVLEVSEPLSEQQPEYREDPVRCVGTYVDDLELDTGDAPSNDDEFSASNDDTVAEIETECGLLSREPYLLAHPAYNGLDLGYIRLFKILKDKAKGKISIHLEPFLLTDAPEYTAISYAWGSPIGTWEVLINGYKLLVPTNLNRFLKQARVSEGIFTKWLWIDMLTIDQRNLEERAKQVIMMPEIFQQAAQVVVWLGPAYKNSDAAMGALSMPGRHWHSKKHRLQLWASSTGSGLWDLCQRSYWHRLWVFQELQVARKVQLMCGSKTVPWNRFEEFMLNADGALEIHRQDNRTAVIKKSPAIQMVKLRMASGDTTLWYLIQKTKHLRCADIRDRAYALLGVIAQAPSDVGRPLIAPDYTMPIPGFVNLILNHVFERSPPEDLNEALEQCKEVERTLGVPPGTAFFMQDKRGLCKDVYNVDSPLRRLGPPGSGISLWWACFYGHPVISSLLIQSWSYEYWEKVTSKQQEDDADKDSSVRIAISQLLVDAYKLGSLGDPPISKEDDIWSSVLDMSLNPTEKRRRNAGGLIAIIAGTLYRAILRKDLGVAKLFLASGGCIASFDHRLSAALLDLLTSKVSRHLKTAWDLLTSKCSRHLRTAWDLIPALRQRPVMESSSLEEIENLTVGPKMSLLIYAILERATGPVLAIVESQRCNLNQIVPTRDVSGIFHESLTALHVVVCMDYSEIARILLEAGHVDVNVHPNEPLEYWGTTYPTPLMFAVKKPSTNCLELLLRREECDVNMRNEAGETALMSAVVEGSSVKAVRLMLKVGHADVNIANDKGRRAIDFARMEVFRLNEKLALMPSHDFYLRRRKKYLAIEKLLLRAENRQLFDELPRLENFGVGSENKKHDHRLHSEPRPAKDPFQRLGNPAILHRNSPPKKDPLVGENDWKQSPLQ